MPSIADPMIALTSFQEEVRKGMPLQACEKHRGLFVMLEKLHGKPRFTYARMEGLEVSGIAMFVLHEPIDGIPCFNIGYAVQEGQRRSGVGTKLLVQAIDELKAGLSRNGISEFYLEAAVSTSNTASQRLAAKVISADPITAEDTESGEPILVYTRHIKG